MNEKFDLQYRLEIEGERTPVEYPLTCQFSVQNTLGQAEPIANFTLYNLSEERRQRLYRDWTNLDLSTALTVIFYGGYGNTLSTLYTGKMWYAYSEHTKTDWITRLVCKISTTGIANVKTISVSKNTKVKDVLNVIKPTLMRQNISIANISPDIANKTLPTGYAYMGNVWNVLKNIAPAYSFDRFGDLHLLEENECVKSTVMNNSTGLLSSPRREKGKIMVSTLLEPNVDVRDYVTLESIDPVYNGNYQVLSIQHAGTISGTQASTATTNLELFVGMKALQYVK